MQTLTRISGVFRDQFKSEAMNLWSALRQHKEFGNEKLLGYDSSCGRVIGMLSMKTAYAKNLFCTLSR